MSGVSVSEIVLHVTNHENRAPDRLEAILDRFTREFLAEKGLPDGDAPIMMTTSRVSGLVRRKLTFQDPDQVIRFLSFWRNEERTFRSLVSAASVSLD